MNREDLIKKWLDHNLNSEEQKAFEMLDDYDELIALNRSLKGFKAPAFNPHDAFNQLKPELTHTPEASRSWWKPLLKIAAIVVLGLSVFYYMSNLDTTITTVIAEQTAITLPDASTVDLNANSSLVYNKNNWDHNRQLHLEGEAFFKVAKGKTFDVITAAGTVSVLGTQFNVKQRDSFFEVVCYEGLVRVSHTMKTTDLKPGERFSIVDGILSEEQSFTSTEPEWLTGESSFYSVPLKHVLAEFENQYDIPLRLENIDTRRLFTGSFTNKNIDLALQSITIPLNLRYRKTGNTIIITRDPISTSNSNN